MFDIVVIRRGKYRVIGEQLLYLGNLAEAAIQFGLTQDFTGKDMVVIPDGAVLTISKIIDTPYRYSMACAFNKNDNKGLNVAGYKFDMVYAHANVKDDFKLKVEKVQ